MARTIEVKRRKPGRPPKYPEGTIPKYYRFPKDLDKKLKQLVESGKFESETEAIYKYVMYSDKLDELFDKIKKLETKIEVLTAENQALRQKISLLEDEKKALKEERHKLLRELQELADEVMRLRNLAPESGEGEKEAQKEAVDVGGVLEAMKEYLKLKEEMRRVKTEAELRDVEREMKKVGDIIDSFLESKGIDKVSFYKTLNFEGLEKAKKMLLGGWNGVGSY